MNWLSYVYPRRLDSRTSRYNKKIEVIESFCRNRLLVDGIEQTGSYTHSLFSQGLRTLKSWHSGSISNILVLGIGGGGIFFDLHCLYPETKIIGIDIDSQIIDIAKKYFGVHDIPNVSLVCSSAQNFLKKMVKKQLFDLVIIDIYNGNDVPNFVTKSQFTRSIRKIVRGGGSVIINYFSFVDQKEKSKDFYNLLSKVFTNVNSEVNHKNIFFYCKN